MNSREERLLRLRATLEERRTIATSDLQQVMAVSRMTLFRDLELLQQQGLVERHFGSVTWTQSLYDLDTSLVTNIEEKRSIAREALKLVSEDDTVFLGAGTTVLEVAKAIAASGLKVTALTNSLPIANAIHRPSSIRLIMTGGDYSEDTRSLLGQVALRSIDGLSGRILFFGANGVDIAGGITAHFSEQVELIRRMMQLCKKTVAVVDSTKFGKISIHRICHLDQVDQIVTDDKLEPSIRSQLANNNVPIVIAGPFTP